MSFCIFHTFIILGWFRIPGLDADVQSSCPRLPQPSPLLLWEGEYPPQVRLISTCRACNLGIACTVVLRFEVQNVLRSVLAVLDRLAIYYSTWVLEHRYKTEWLWTNCMMLSFSRAVLGRCARSGGQKVHMKMTKTRTITTTAIRPSLAAATSPSHLAPPFQRRHCSQTSPSAAQTQRRLADRFIQGYNDLTVSSLLAPRAERCEHHVLPANLRRPVRGNEEYAAFFAPLIPHLKGFKVRDKRFSPPPALSID